jgi:hypothetical protein
MQDKAQDEDKSTIVNPHPELEIIVLLCSRPEFLDLLA